MPRISAFSIAQEDIEEYFDQLESKAFKVDDLERIFEENKKFWRLPKSWHYYKFIEALEEKTEHFTEVSLEFPHRTVTRFIWKSVLPLNLALSISPKVYLSHYSAMSLHGLTDQVPKNYYVTLEQSPKKQRGVLKQESINKAFGKPQRLSENKAEVPDGYIYLLHGKATNRVGVTKKKYESDELTTTNIERTLIDAAVRPAYCGGVYEVLEAYKRAAGKISVNKMAAMLRKIDYLYPYHQTIGFYLEKSQAYKETQVSLFKRFEFEFDFYLTYNMKEKEYSKEWRLYYPKGF